MSDQEANKELNRRFIQRVFNDHDLSGIDEMLSDDFVEHVEFPGFAQDRDGVKKFFAAMFAAFPDFSAEIQDMAAQDDRVAIRSTFSGTHQGEYMGIPATGKHISIGAFDMVRVADGRATEHWGILDAMGMMGQMGVLPGPPEGAESPPE